MLGHSPIAAVPVAAQAAGDGTNVGTAAVILADFVSAASGTSIVTGTGAATTSTTASAVGTPVVMGSAAAVLDDFVSAANGTPVVVGAAAASTDTTAAGAGTSIVTGSAAIVLDAFTCSAQGGTNLGDVAATLQDFTSQAQGTSGYPDLNGVAAIVLADFEAHAFGIVDTTNEVTAEVGAKVPVVAAGGDVPHVFGLRVPVISQSARVGSVVSGVEVQ